MGTLNVRIDPETAALVDRIAHERGLTKSEVVREALAILRERETETTGIPSRSRMARIIGSWDSGGMRLSERTGEKFAALLQEIKHAKRARGRRSARRAH